MEVKFSDGGPGLDSYELEPWEVGELRLVEFFPGKLVRVKLTSVESGEFEECLMGIVDQGPIALDLEWDNELCLFQFCTSKGVLVVRHEKHEGDPVLKEFLLSHQFFGKGAANDRRQLRMKFGCDFDCIEDIAETRLVPYGHSENFMQMTLQFAGAPAAIFKDVRVAKSSWSRKVLSMRQVLYAAFDVVAIYECYPKLPPPRFRHKPSKAKEVVCVGSKGHRKERKRCESRQTVKKVVMRQNNLRETYAYVMRDYGGSKVRQCLLELCRVSSESVDVLSSDYCHVFLSVFEPVNVEGFVELPRLKCESLDGDILYVTDIPSCLANYQNFEKFLYLFGTDQRISFKGSYCRVECCSAQVSCRLRTFLPALEIDGSKMRLWEFPFFMNKVCVSNLPPQFSDGDIMNVFKCIGIEPHAIELEKRRDIHDQVSAIVSLSSPQECQRAIDELNYRIHNELEMRIWSFIEEPQARWMRQYLLYVEHPKSSAEFMRSFSRYGKVHYAFVDPDLQIGLVQFYSQTDALKVPVTEGHFAEKGSTVVLRDVPISVSRERLIAMCREHGDVLGVALRLVIPRFGYQVFEVTFSSTAAAQQAKLAFNGSQIDQLQIIANIYLGAGQEVPVWKMEQRYLWVAVSPPVDEETLRRNYPLILDVNITESASYIMFPSREEASKSGHRQISLTEFVECTGSCCLALQDAPQQNPVPFESQQWAIVIDPIPASFSASVMKDWCPGCFYDLVVLPSPTTGLRRAVLFIEGHKMTKKIYALIRNKSLDGEPLHVTQMKREEIPHIPAPMAVIIDPLPDTIDEKRIRGNILMGREAHIDVLDSGCSGAKAMIIWPANRCDGKIIAKGLKEWSLSIKKVYK